MDPNNPQQPTPPASPPPSSTPPEQPPAPPAPPTTPPATDGRKVLLVEDEDFIRELYQRQLNQIGLVTDGAANGAEGLDFLNKGKYNIILLDIMLPDMNGLEILKKVKEDPTHKTTPVVLLTNLGQESVIKQGFDLGAEGYLIKASYTPNQVVQEVKNFLDGKPSNISQS